jgi:hypothetical protein
VSAERVCAHRANRVEADVLDQLYGIFTDRDRHSHGSNRSGTSSRWTSGIAHAPNFTPNKPSRLSLLQRRSTINQLEQASRPSTMDMTALKDRRSRQERASSADNDRRGSQAGGDFSVARKLSAVLQSGVRRSDMSDLFASQQRAAHFLTAAGSVSSAGYMASSNPSSSRDEVQAGVQGHKSSRPNLCELSPCTEDSFASAERKRSTASGNNLLHAALAEGQSRPSPPPASRGATPRGAVPETMSFRITHETRDLPTPVDAQATAPAHPRTLACALACVLSRSVAQSGESLCA